MLKPTDFQVVKSESHRFSILQLTLSAVIVAFLASCAAPKTTKIVQQPEVAKTAEPEQQSASYFIRQSKEQTGKQALNSLITASDYQLAEGQPLKALWLANQLQAQTSGQQEYRLLIVKAQALLELEQIDLAWQQLVKAQSVNTDLDVKYYRLAHQVNLARGFTLDALDAQLFAFSMNPQAGEEEIEALWQAFQQLSSWQLSQLDNNKAPYLSGWVQLTKYAHRFGDDLSAFHRYLQQWRRQFPTHPANNLVGQLLNKEKAYPLGAQRIAVILPLSGRQQAAGSAAQQGILAAYQEQSITKLHFFDSETLDWTTLKSTLETLEIDYVIGPLLRERVNQYLAIDDITIPSLLLNVSAQHTLSENQFAISMRPEDEAVQAAATLARKDYQMPIVLVHQDQVSQRIATAFVDEWQRVTGYAPKLMPFSKGKKMQTMLKSALGVFQSKARIDDLNSRIKHTIKAETRNRRDIDMIYIVGSATQTRLLKPHIDVSISPFADTIPIYASSRSHSLAVDEGDTRDLAGMSFTEMPWLLASQAQNKPLMQVTKQLFPTRSDSLQRIFAMGYDSLALVNKLALMQKYPYVRHYGQVGTLQLAANQILTRTLLWGRYNKDSVQQIAMD
ncbi:hypothetical protein DXX92_02800 [Thalassotalea euphylliae]|uniref:Penicillin-binding protein activator n=1 Tax=Thalassotalea euphylliae TaxID=1655234 RepID=A0A3E0UE37_9GAMM|nr:hypothetical protein DXX92_02800 [Thalassotalea euphylliae]